MYEGTITPSMTIQTSHTFNDDYIIVIQGISGMKVYDTNRWYDGITALSISVVGTAQGNTRGAANIIGTVYGAQTQDIGTIQYVPMSISGQNIISPSNFQMTNGKVYLIKK